MLGLHIFILASSKFLQSSEFVVQTHHALSYACLSTFFLSFACSIAYLRFFGSLYGKSLWYYFFIGICVSVLFIISVSTVDNFIKKLLPYLAFLLGLNILLSNFIAFPNGVYSSGDTHYQIYTIVLPIIKNGHVPSGFIYSFFPVHQILVASLSIIMGIEPVFLYMSGTALLYAVSALFVYSLMNRTATAKFGITAMLLFLTAPSIFYNGTHSYQFSYALPLGMLLMYVTTLLTVSSGTQNTIQSQMSWKLIRVLAILVLVWAHQFTSTIIVVLIVILEITYYIISINNINKSSIYHSVLLLYIAILFFHWIYVSYGLSSLMMVFNVYSSSLLNLENYQAASSTLNSNIFLRPFWLTLLDTSGRGIMMMLVLMGSLYGMWKKNMCVFIWFTMGIFIWTLISIGAFIKMPLLLGDRMFTFSETMSFVYLSTFGVMLLIERFGIKGLTFCIILFLVLPILSLGSTLSGSETSIFLGDQPYIKLYDTNSDLQYRAWINEKVPENSSVKVSESWVPQFLDSVRVYDNLPIDDQDNLVDNKLKLGEYIVLNKHDSMGLRVRGISESEQIKLIDSENSSTVEAQKLQERVTKLDLSELRRVASKLDYVYSNGETDICLK